MWTVDVYPRWSDSLLTSLTVSDKAAARNVARAICDSGIEHEDETGDLSFTPGHAIDQVIFYPHE